MHKKRLVFCKTCPKLFFFLTLVLRPFEKKSFYFALQDSHLFKFWKQKTPTKSAFTCFWLFFELQNGIYFQIFFHRSSLKVLESFSKKRLNSNSYMLLNFAETDTCKSNVNCELYFAVYLKTQL